MGRCLRTSVKDARYLATDDGRAKKIIAAEASSTKMPQQLSAPLATAMGTTWLLYTSDAAHEAATVTLGSRTNI